MAIDRVAARRRVRTITGWAAGGAAALTAAFAFGASRGTHVAKAPAPAAGGSAEGLPQQTLPQDPQAGYPQDNQGFAPPTASSAPPAGMSGGS